jgi:hypothetical protein
MPSKFMEKRLRILELYQIQHTVHAGFKKKIKDAL